MANYCGIARTNYVHVLDREGLEKSIASFAIKLVEGDDGLIALFDDHPDGSGWEWHSFDDDGNDLDFDMEKQVMPFIAENEALILMETGHEKMRYMIGYAQAWIRRGDTVEALQISLSNIYDMVEKAWGGKPTVCEW